MTHSRLRARANSRHRTGRANLLLTFFLDRYLVTTYKRTRLPSAFNSNSAGGVGNGRRWCSSQFLHFPRSTVHKLHKIQQRVKRLKNTLGVLLRRRLQCLPHLKNGSLKPNISNSESRHPLHHIPQKSIFQNYWERCSSYAPPRSTGNVSPQLYSGNSAPHNSARGIEIFFFRLSNIGRLIFASAFGLHRGKLRLYIKNVRVLTLIGLRW